MGVRGKRRHYRLTERVCRQAGPGRYSDGFGLYLVVRPDGSRAFVQRLVVNGRRRDIGLGGFPVTTLAAARAAAMENLRLRQQGIDPIAHRRHPNGVPTVRELLEELVTARKSHWAGAQTESSWRRDFKRYVYPFVGETRVDCVTVADVARMVEPYWHGRGSVGYSVRQRLDVLFRRAKVLKYRPDNPAHEILELLPPVRREQDHRPSIPHTEVRSALEALWASSAPEHVKNVFSFIVLTAARLSEGTGARWSEIKFERSVWELPAERMKAKHEHQVPLSIQALDILERVRRPGNPFVFRFRRPDGKLGPVSGESLNYWMRKLAMRSSDGRYAVLHGLRSSFRNWNVEVGGFPGEAAEAALAHRESATVRAYLHNGPLFNVRVGLMQSWADYVLPRSSR